jgi:hypothetical protein
VVGDGEVGRIGWGEVLVSGGMMTEEMEGRTGEVDERKKETEPLEDIGE